MNAKELADLAEQLLSKKQPLNSLHQEIAENFYPERADFTVSRSLGDDFAANLMTSYPLMCRRDLGNQLGTMLRPTAKPWFHAARKFSTKDKEDDHAVRAQFEYFEETMRRAMYDPPALFNRATKIADHDFASFGQAAMSLELNRRGDTLLFRTWHLRDMAWQENAEGQIGFVTRKWKPSIRTLVDTFGKDKLHSDINNKLGKEPFCESDVRHIVCDADMYSEQARGRPRWSIWWDAEHNQIIEATPIWGKHYIIPRWQVINSQYAYSPAVVAALPDARLIQAMTFTLLEVGEKAANPPMIATAETVRSDVAVFAGGITWVDQDYDERLGEALRPIAQDFRGIGHGLEMAQDTRALITRAFFLDTLNLPVQTPEMTAYEVGQRIQEYIRNALPIFEPMETEYNAAICDETFELLMRNGAFGSPLDWPRQMRGMEVEFRFESPLHDVMDKQKTQQWMEAKGMVADAIALDPSAAFVLNTQYGLRDALSNFPAKWLNSEEDVERAMQQRQEQQQTEQLLAAMEQGSNVTANLAGAERDMAQAGTL